MEIKSFKCDICGEVYHVAEEEQQEFLTIHKYCVCPDEGEVTSYKHICPGCTNYITAYINDPTIKETQYKVRRAVSKLEDCLARLLRSVSEFHPFWYGSGVENPEYYDEITDDIVRNIDELKESFEKRTRKQLWAIRVLGFVVWFLACYSLIQLFM